MKQTGLVGTDPKYPSVVDHSWLNVDPSTYDNYPSDNNPVRVLPELAKLWRTGDVSTTLIPNVEVRDLTGRTADEDAVTNVPEVIREAKKAMMAGKVGAEVAEYLRSRFNKRQIEAAAEELKSISSEMGLLGNVYVDVGAFKTFDEADKFLSNHRARLARDLLFDPSQISPSVVIKLASKHRKNATTEVSYDQENLDRYKDHLVTAGRIPSSFGITTKEELRKAFLYEAPDKDTRRMFPIREEKKANREEAAEQLRALTAETQKKALENSQAVLIPQVRPILSFIQENLSKGKDRADLKDMLRSKFASNDIEAAAPFIALVISKKGLSAEDLAEKVEAGELAECMADEIKKIAKKFPVARSEYGDVPKATTSAQPGYFYSLNGHNASTKFASLRSAAAKALEKGFKLECVYAKLAEKVSREDAQVILREAISDMNARSAGAVANRARRSNDKVIFEETPRQTLPDPSTIKAQQEEFIRMFEGAGELQIDLGKQLDYTPMNITFDTANSESLDAAL